MARKAKTLEERLADLELRVADQAELIEEIYALLSAESVHRLHAVGHSNLRIAELIGRPASYVKKVLRDQASAKA
jgi:uncharacterized coiled-coil protein SlyX